MSSAMKYSRHPSFPQDNASYLASGWFWKMTMREWSFAQLDVVDNVPIDPTFQAGTNHPALMREMRLARSADPKKVTISFYAHSAGNAYVHLRSPTAANPFEAVEKILMQVEVVARRSGTPASIALTRLDGITAVINAPDTGNYDLGTTTTFAGKNPLELFNTVPPQANHVVISSHGIEVGGAVCMFPGGASKPSLRLGNDNVEDVFRTLKGKVAEKNCVVWLGGCAIGENKEFCTKAANASGCPVFAAGYVLPNRRYTKGYVDVLDKLALPRLYLPGEREPQSIGDFCAMQEKYKFNVPV